MSSPSKPVSIGSPRPQRLLDDGQEANTGANTPDIRQLRQQFGTPPAGTVIPPFRTPGTSTPLAVGSPLRPSSSVDNRIRPIPQVLAPNASADANAQLDIPDTTALTEEEKVRVLRKHLVSREQRLGHNKTGSTNSRPSSRPPSVHEQGSNKDTSRRPSRPPSPGPSREHSEPFPLPYNAPGGDITHEIYKYQERAHRNARPRAASVIVPAHTIQQDPAFEHIHEPGGFRRNYVLLHANQHGLEEPPVTSTFIDFLYLFGHFAGEDLEEDTDDDELETIDEEASLHVSPSRIQPSRSQSILRRDTDIISPLTGLHPRHVRTTQEPSRLLEEELTESTPLLRESSMQRRASRRSLSRTRRSRRSSIGQHGDATVSQAILMLLKAFIGTGILFLGKAFSNGGMLFSAVTLVLIALISLFSFLLLVDTKMVVPGSFGDIGGAIYGKWMRRAILTSIVISQLGFVSAYTIFVAENLQAFVMSVSKCKTLIPIQLLIFSQLIVFLPLAMIRNLAKLSLTALIADVFILIGIVYIGWNEALVIMERGVAPVRWFNEKDFPLLIGTAVFSFEGIGLVIPITDAMREPRKFPPVLTGVMFFLIFLFGGAGVLSYAAYGEEIQTVVIKNLPQDNKFVQAVQFLYSLAILLSAPLQLFPALRIMENWLFTQSGKVNVRVKWQKNFFRTCLIIATYFVSWVGAQDLDKFVAFVGSFACVPLCFVYPAMLHLKACARTRRERIQDWLMIAFGTIAAIYTTAQTIKLAAEPSSGGPKFENCPQTPQPGGQ
ncbi:Vacuolar amino acid transporter 3 [Serendipita indica DSM 11827]|uniref:Related to AVT3-Vacuolar transporter, involved in amino acid efflux from the vacuole n=1 Tax=Serendipita indica (strain DSM 11827) TaxID=1109443 RepID=G4U391_SERID|nr:Vacuolar amino acid transporter 3 [Serendipita indica DSM 11827]CCA78050.1 related to AVT3-Vacuolar transporter, involved in amino acid efflux from the vacuole [Serendipita indica DSM 11827]